MTVLDRKNPKESARNAFLRARTRALLRSVWSGLHGRSNQLLEYDDVKRRLRVGQPLYRGVTQVLINEIAGSVNRYRDFDRAFMPTQVHTRDRWRRIGEARFEEIKLPPVQLYRIGDVYFVLDGNHRVSVARQLGQEFIDAEVYEARVRVPLRADVDPEDIDIIQERLDFVEHTGIDEIRPDLDITITVPGGYYRLLEHIETHRYLQGIEWEREFSTEEAVRQWVDQVYLPTVGIIREADILDEFPGRTEADLYLWIIEHFYFLQERYGDRVTLWDSARDFADHFTPRLFRRVWHWLRDHLFRRQPITES